MLIYELPYELPNDVRLGILGNEETLLKSRGGTTKCSASRQKYIFGTGAKKKAISDIKVFRYCLTLLDFSIFPEIFCRGLYVC